MTSSDRISFRPLTRTDFPLLQRWFAEPHVERWWRENPELQNIEAKYGPRIDRKEATHVFIVELAKEAFGLIQWYRWADYPEHAAQLGAGPRSAGIDLAIGDPQLVGRGLGSALVRKFLDQLVFADPSISSCIADPETANQRSLRAFARAGFRPVREVTLRGEIAPRTVVEKINPAATTSATR